MSFLSCLSFLKDDGTSDNDNAGGFASNFNNSNNNSDKAALTVTRVRAVRGKGQLPYWFVYIGWVLVFLAIFVSGFFTILYSMQWGKTTSTDWLTAFLLSFVQSAVLIQPIKVCIFFSMWLIIFYF